jgi:protein involved in polysaccharide export with SLBB domain
MSRAMQKDRDAGLKGLGPPSLRQALCGLPFLVVPCLLASPGCIHTHPKVTKQLMADQRPNAPGPDLASTYLVLCPDVIEVTVIDRPDLRVRAAVGPDGRADLGDLGKPRVEGRPAAKIAQLVEEQAAQPTDHVQVRVLEYNSQHVYLFGEVGGLRGAVPYRGPETVQDLLKRVGGLAKGGAPDDVYVIRPHITEGSRPEVFHVDLRAIVLKGDQSTNLRVQPFDQVHVGETHQAKWKHCIPPILHSLFAKDEN